MGVRTSSLDHKGKATSKHQPKNYDILKSVFLSLCEEIGRDWMMLGRILSINDAELEYIDNEKVCLKEKAYRMLCLWRKHHESPTLDVLVKALEEAGRRDLINILKAKTSERPIRIVGNFPDGCVFKLDLQSNNEQLTNVEFKTEEAKIQWEVISKVDHKSDSYYITKHEDKILFVKVENFKDYGKVKFKFSFENSKGKRQRSDCFEVLINEICKYEISCNQLRIVIPDPCFSNQFPWIDQNPPMPEYLDWRNKTSSQSKLSKEKPIQEFALEYFERNFVDLNQVICFPPLMIDEEIDTICIPRLFTELFKKELKEGIRAVLSNYDLYHHATLLNCKPQEHIERCSANRVVIFYSKINLIFIVRAASSSDYINQESKNCSADVKYFANINKPVIEEKALTILGVVACCSIERKDLKQELTFQFSSKFQNELYNVLFICQDELKTYQTLNGWWRKEFYKFCLNKNSQINDEGLFKQVLGLTMLIIAKCDVTLPTLKPDTSLQIKSLILNPEQMDAINDKELKKIITGGFGSGKSVVGREIVKSFYAKSSKCSTLYYICCDHFSLFQCEMKEFTDSLEKDSKSNVKIVCENLVELWQNQDLYKNKDISLPQLLQYYSKNGSAEVNFVLDELPGEYVREEDANELKKLFSSFLKESLVVFIPKSIEKNRYLNIDGEKQMLESNCFHEEKIGMKNIILEKSMRVTKCIQLLIDSAQDTISKSNTVLYLTQQEHQSKVQQKDDAKDYHDYDLDQGAKIVSNGQKVVGSNIYIESQFVFKPGVSGHSIEGEKPKVIFLPSLIWTKESSAKILSVILEKICFDKVRGTAVLCNNMDEVKMVAYAIDIIENYQAVVYSPYLQKYNPTIEKKISVTTKVKESQQNVLVADSRAMCGVESEVVIVLVKPEEYYVRHVIADICARCNSYLIVFVLPSENLGFQKGGTIKEVLDNWSEDIVQKIQVKISNDENQLCRCTNGSLYINKQCKDFKDRGAKKNFVNYIENSYFKINDENNIIYERLVSDIFNKSKSTEKEIKQIQVDSASYKPAVSILADHTLLEPTPSSFTHTGLQSSSAADEYLEQKELSESMEIDCQYKSAGIPMMTSGGIKPNKPKKFQKWLKRLKTLFKADETFETEDPKRESPSIFKAVRYSLDLSFNSMESRFQNEEDETFETENPKRESPSICIAMGYSFDMSCSSMESRFDNGGGIPLMKCRGTNFRNPSKPLVAQVELESDKTAVSLHIDLNLSQSTPSSSSNEGPPRVAAIHDSAADDDEEKVNVLKDQTKMSDILDNSELLLQLAMMVGEDWLNLGRFLLVSDNELDIIDVGYNSLKEKAHRMLSTWKNQQNFPTLDALAKAIYKINRSDLIRVMEKFSNKSFETENPLKPSIEEKEKMCEALKKFYLKTYGKMDEIVHLVRTPAKVKLSDKFIELTVVDADEVGRDTFNIVERELFLQRQLTYQPIKFKEVFSKELSLLLISGIAGIGKTCLLRKCLLDWANGTLWKNVDLVFYLECRKLNQYQNISNINELLKVFYEDIFQESDVCNHFSILFVIDGLDEFAHIDELINNDPQYPSKQPIINALAEALNTQKHKCVVSGRIGAVLQYKDKVIECADKLTIQIMGFNDNRINEYVESIGNKKEAIKSVLKESYFAKSMASVPFYLSAMCAIIAASDFYSFNTMTELYCSIFLYFFQKHICKTDETVYSMMQSESNKQHVLRICKVAWELFNQGKIIFSQEEMKGIVNDFDKVENELLGFIERVESQLGYQYQFAHLTLMEFCASVHAHVYLSTEEIMSNKKLRSCLPMICGLANENKESLMRFLPNLKNSNEERNSLLNAVLEVVYWRIEQKMFLECFFEAQALFTEDLKRSIDERDWRIYIREGKTAHEISHEKYFMEKFLDAGCKLDGLFVEKNVLSEDEKMLLVLCSTNVRDVCLYHPVKIDEWTPKHEIESLSIYIILTFVSKNDFEGFVLPWIRLAEALDLELHDDTNFIDDICEWLRGSNFKRLMIKYRGEYFNNIEEFKVKNTKNV